MLPIPCRHAPYEDARRAASSLLLTVRLARGLVEELRPVELAGLEEEVGRLCARALDLAPEQGRALEPLLSQLATAMDLLTTSLQTVHE